MHQYLLLSGTSHQELAIAISQKAKIQFAYCAIERISDGEISVRLLESVRQQSMVLAQSLSPPVNEHLAAYFDTSTSLAYQFLIKIRKVPDEKFTIVDLGACLASRTLQYVYNWMHPS